MVLARLLVMVALVSCNTERRRDDHVVGSGSGEPADAARRDAGAGGPLVIRIDEDPARWDAAWAVAIDAADRMIVTGDGPGPETRLAWTSALARSGRIVWTDRHDPGSEGPDTGYAVAVARDGSVFVAGEWYSSSWTRVNPFVRRLGSDGAPWWSREGEAIGDDGLRAIALDEERGAIYVAGSRPDPVHEGAVQAWLRRIDLDGALVWERGWSGATARDDHALAVAVAPDGAVLVAGRSVTAERGTDAWVAAYSPAGDATWSELRGSEGDDAAEAIAIARDGSFALAGTRAGAGWIARYDAARRFLGETLAPDVGGWRGAAFDLARAELVVAGGELARAYAGGVATWTDRQAGLAANAVAVDATGAVVVAGSIEDDLAIVKFSR